MGQEARGSGSVEATVVQDPARGAGLRVFIVHAPEDAWFVEGFLVRALNLPAGEVLLSSKLAPGAVIVDEIARGAASPVTVVVVSPGFLASPWAQFANQLALQHTIEAEDDGNATLVPAILADCDLPLLSRFRAPLDFRDPAREHWEAEVARLRTRLAAPAPTAAALACPYPGLRPFTADDAASFCGRDSEVRELLGRLRDGQRELYVIGPSGSGKSSLVAAGLVPSLRDTPDLAGGAFVVRQLRPGAAPIAALAGGLEATAAERAAAGAPWLSDAIGRLLATSAAHAAGTRLLVFVDQLEELFTTTTAAPRAAFIAALRALRGDARVALVLALRADFYASLMESALWTDLDGQLARLDVSPLRGHRLAQAIEAPARALGVYFEPVLLERLLHDVADEPGALPLLQDTLVDLWHHRTHGLLRLAEYEAMSDGARTGLAVTVARRADGALGELSPGRRDIARRVFLRLVQFGDGAATTRRQQTRAELATTGDAADEIDAVVGNLADRRLITTSGGEGVAGAARIDLAHEILLSAWPALGEWIRTRKQDEQRRRVLEAKAAEWVHGGRGASRLLDADELREARGWLDDDKVRDLGVSGDIQGLLARSAAALAAQAADAEARHRRWRRLVTVALSGLTIAVVAVSTLAVIAGRRSRVASDKSREVQLQLARTRTSQGAEQLMTGHPARALPYLVAAREAGAEDVPLRILFRWAGHGLPVQRVVHDGVVTAVAWSPDGRRLATASTDHTVRIWDAVTGRSMTLPHPDAVRGLAWSPDGLWLATASDRGGQVWETIGGQVVTLPFAYGRGVRAVAWSPDGRWLATASDDATARIWDARSGQPVTPALVHRRRVNAVAWSRDGRWLATASDDGTAQVWDPRTGEVVAPPLAHHGAVSALGWSPDSRRVATASEDKTARVWDAATGRALTPPLGHQEVVTAVAWSPDGTRLATASADRTAQVWNAGSGERATAPFVHHDAVTAVAWSPDGLRVATASTDQTALIWDAVTGRPVTAPLEHEGAVTALAWSADGTRLATASEDMVARVWDAANGQSDTPAPLAHHDLVTVVAWSPDGRRVATASSDQTARVWDAASGTPITAPLVHQGQVTALAWSPDGQRLATASADQTARVWDGRTGHPETPPLAHQAWVAAVVWSPDGRRLATISYDRMARVWDPATGQLVTPPLEHQAPLRAIAWSPDGTHLVTTSDDQIAHGWDAVTGQATAPLLAHFGEIVAAAWSPDGQQVAIASVDHTARVWRPASGIATPPLPHHERISAVAWSPDGTRLATGSWDQTARVWDAATGQPETPPMVHLGAVTSVAWSPDGRRLATTSGGDNTARVWDAASGQAVTPPLVHAHGWVSAVAWSGDGRRIVTASGATAQLWDVSWDPGTLADWRAALDQGDYRLNKYGILVARDLADRGVLTAAADGHAWTARHE